MSRTRNSRYTDPATGESVVVTDRRRNRGIVDRPLDAFVAGFLIVAGAYVFVDPEWPEKVGTPGIVVITIQAAYFLASGLAIIAALVMRQLNRYIIRATALSMFAWAFVAASATSVVVLSPWIPVVNTEGDHPLVDDLWPLFWAGLAVAAAVRAWGMWRWWKGK